jgi:gluconate 5-dehydrogenase
MRSDLFDLTGKVALVTGAARGIGFAIARELGRAGAAVIVNGRNAARLDEATAALSAEGARAHAAVFDVRDTESVRKRVAGIEREVGPIHILVNNAGIQRRMPLEQCDEATWREVLDTNLTAVFTVTQAVVQAMIARRAGKIINIGSLMCELGRPSVGPYTAAKGGVRQLTKAMAVDWGKYNIQVNGIGPGYIATEMNRPLLDDANFDAWVRGRTPAGRWGDPAEVAGAAVFLASRASDFVTGQMLYVDGGVLASL